MHNKLLAAALLQLAGCRPIYPADRLVIVELSPTLEPLRLRTSAGWSKVADLAREGIHYWNQLGAELKLRDELTPFDDPGAPVLRFHEGTLSPDLDGYFDWQSAQITIDMRKFYAGLPSLFVASMFAHEAGHALGLDHVAEPRAIMFHIPGALAEPSPADDAEFHRATGR